MANADRRRHCVGTGVRSCDWSSGAADGTGGGDAPCHLVSRSGGNFRFFDVRLYAFADPQGAAAEVKAEGLIKPTGRVYHQDYVLFLRTAGGKIVFLREYFDPVRAAKALDAPILGLDS